MFFQMFLAALLAGWLLRGVDDYTQSHRRWKVYCLAWAARHQKWAGRHKDKDSPEATKEWAEYSYWVKQSKSWWGMRPYDIDAAVKEELKRDDC